MHKRALLKESDNTYVHMYNAKLIFARGRRAETLWSAGCPECLFLSLNHKFLDLKAAKKGHRCAGDTVGEGRVRKTWVILGGWATLKVMKIYSRTSSPMSIGDWFQGSPSHGC